MVNLIPSTSTVLRDQGIVVEEMPSSLISKTGLGHKYTPFENSPSADAPIDSDHPARPTGSSSPASPINDADDQHTGSFCSTAPSLPLEEDAYGEGDHISATQVSPGKAEVVSLPDPTLSALRLFECLQHPRRRAPEARDDAEVVEIDISPREYQLLWWLLGQEKEQDQDLLGGRWLKQDTRRPPASSYLPLLQQSLPEIGSVEELHDLGRWVLDSVRYDFVQVLDVANQAQTRLYVRMPSIIHDRTAHYAGLLFKQSIEAVLNEDVDALNGSECKFTDKFYQMIEKDKEEASRAHQPTAPRTRSQSRSLVHLPVHAATRAEGSSAAVGDIEVREEKARFEAVHPDVCIYTGDEHNIPAIIIEVGFSHPLPFDRARSYIYGSEGKCRIVACLDIEYKPREVRQQMYEHLLSDPEQQQSYQHRLPPYGLILNLFRCSPESAGSNKITYVAKHDLRDVDVREAARLGKALELRPAELADPVEDEDSAYDGDDSEDSEPSGDGVDLIRIPYAELVKLVDKAVWVHAVSEQPSLQPQTRKRQWEAKLPSTSPEPGNRRGHSRRKRAKR